MRANEDLDLRQEFVRLRREETATVPAFAPTLEAARRKAAGRPSSARWGFALAMPLAAAAGLALWLVAGQETPSPSATPTEVALGAPLENWATPTDYLLDGPGIELLDSLPELGDADSYDTELTTDIEPQADASVGGLRRYV